MRKNNMRTPEEKEKIVKDLISGKTSWAETYKKYSLSESTLSRWKYAYLEKELKRIDPPEVKIEKAKQSVRRLLDFNYNGINEILIEEVVEKIIVLKDWFEWKLVFLNELINLEVKGKKQDYFIIEHKNT